MSEPTGAAAVMPDFEDAIGLDQLLAGARVPGPASEASVGAPGARPAAPSASPAVGPTWPPPPTPEPFAQLVGQLDMVASKLTSILTGVPLEPEDPKFVREVADGCWPLVYTYGAGSDRPSRGVLWLYALASIGGLVTVKVAAWQDARARAAKAP